MIPFALAAAYLYTEKDVLETRITELNEDNLVVRVSEALDHDVAVDLEILLFQEKKGTYWKNRYHKLIPELIEKNEFWSEYRFVMENPIYRDKVMDLWKAYDRYAYLKLETTDLQLAEEMIHYPVQKEAAVAQYFEEQQGKWYEEAGMELQKNPSANQKSFSDANLPVFFVLDHPKAYQEFMNSSMADFYQAQFKKKNLLGHPFSKVIPTGVYIGNSFCHFLLPKERELVELLEKADKEKLQITLSFPCVPQHRMVQTADLLDGLYDWCRKRGCMIELEINDWGMLGLMKNKTDFLRPVLGRLLNKRRKDPRNKYYQAWLDGLVLTKENSRGKAENGMVTDFYQEYLKCEYGIERIEWEVSGDEFLIPKGKNTLHLPYYQTNTSQYCPLYAAIKEGDRGKQQEPKNCPLYCMDWTFLYPDHLQMLGRYNSLFGYDARSLGDMTYLAGLMKHGFDRIAINLF